MLPGNQGPTRSISRLHLRNASRRSPPQVPGSARPHGNSDPRVRSPRELAVRASNASPRRPRGNNFRRARPDRGAHGRARTRHKRGPGASRVIHGGVRALGASARARPRDRRPRRRRRCHKRTHHRRAASRHIHPRRARLHDRPLERMGCPSRAAHRLA